MNDLLNDEGDVNCQEIQILKDNFHQLLSDFNFTQNNFLKQQSEVLALVELAQSFVVYSGKNYKAVGICYNNIGNLHYKCEKYKLAAESFNKAV